VAPPQIEAAAPTGPMQILSSRPPWRETLISLRVHNYRLFAGSNLVANTALWMQRIAMDWLVLTLSGSVAAVGVTVAMQFAPMLLFGLFGGVIVDRYPKRNLLMITQSVAAILAAALAVLTLSGSVQVWQVWGISFILGLVTVIDNPARQVFVNELVGPHYLRNAISLNASIFQMGGLIGPALGGILITAVGAGWAFGINSLACIAVVITISRLDTSALHASVKSPRRKGQLVEGIRYVVAKPVIFWTIVMLAFLSIFAFNMPVFLSAYANNVYHVGAQGYGLFNAVVAAGAFTGAILSTRRLTVRLSTVITAAGALGVIQVVAGLAPNEIAFAVLLAGTGVANLLFITGANSLIQMSSNVQIRGRVMSVYILVLLGGQAIGGPIMGQVVELIGPHISMVISGAVPAAAAIAIAIMIAHSARLRLRVSLRGATPLVSIVHRTSRKQSAAAA
jgi:MFS family permease